MTRERISRILELREILLSFKTGFSLVNAAVICAVLERLSLVITEPSYLQLVTVSSFCPFTLISVLMPLVLSVISLVFSALTSTPLAVEALSRCSARFASSSSSPARPSMSSATQRLVILLPPMLTVPSWSSKASVVILSRNMLKRMGESRHPCWTPTVVQNQPPMLLLKKTAYEINSRLVGSEMCIRDSVYSHPPSSTYFWKGS